MSGKSATTLSVPADFFAPVAEVFPAYGIVDLAPALESAEFKQHLATYDRWVAEGHHGAMEYLKRGRDRRADPRLVFPETRSILCILEPYAKAPLGETSPLVGPRYARYLRGADYHERIASRLEGALERVRGTSDPQLRWKVCVDTSAVLERAWAQLSGLGWVGKNSLLIHPQLGSYVFVGVALLNREFGVGPQLLPDYCGRCERCLTACPTSAITREKTVLSRQCIAYWTLEKRGELEFAPASQSQMGNWVAGCDICQEVCPFNTKPVKQDVTPAEAQPLRTYLEHLRETETDYRARVRDSSLSRVKPVQFKRNVLLALENSLNALGDSEWALTDLPSELLDALADFSRFYPDLTELTERCREKLIARLAKCGES